jgi:hypothetical protein
MLAIFTWVIFFTPQPVYADTTSLTIAPSVLKIHAAPSSTVIAPFSITNNGNDALHLELEIRFFRDAGNDDGSIMYINQTNTKGSKSNQNFIKTVQVTDPKDQDIPVSSLDLGPKQRKELTLHIDVSRNEPAADYYFSVLFLTTPPSSDNKTSQPAIQTGIALQVLTSIGSTDTEAYINNFSVPFYLQSGPVPFTLRIANVGKQYVTPKGTILIRNMFGQTIGKVDVAPASVLSSSFRTIPDSQQYLQQSNESNEMTPQIIWPEKFLLGFYTATLSLTLAPNTTVETKTVHFFAFPLQLLLISLILLLLLIVIIVRVRKRIF